MVKIGSIPARWYAPSSLSKGLVTSTVSKGISRSYYQCSVEVALWMSRTSLPGKSIT